MSTTLQIRVNKKTKVVKSKTIPFPIRTANGFTPAQERRMIKEGNEALRSGKSYKTASELHADILK